MPKRFEPDSPREAARIIREEHEELKVLLRISARQLPDEGRRPFVAVRLYFWKNTSLRLNLGARQRLAVSLVAGAVLGLVAGAIGIGGGIYLVPLIIILGLGTTKEAAACGAIFIWLNSLSGLAARLQYNAIDLQQYVPLIFAVFLGGALGSWRGAGRYSAQTMERVLGVVIIVAIVILIRKLLTDR